MKKSYLFLAMLVVGAGAAAMMPSGSLTASSSLGGESMTAQIKPVTSGAFRDGLYMGKFTAERGFPRRVVSGRWATPENRALFAAGYEQGYSEFVASRAASANLPTVN